MKTVVFGYNFEHWKTQATLVNMVLCGMRPDALILADWEELTIPKSILSVTPWYRFLHSPKSISTVLGIPVVKVFRHNSTECERFLTENNFELGIVAGARILKERIIRKVKHGIVNIHPGKLPECRGLDTLKWSIQDDIELEVTAHFIDKHVDRGLKIKSRAVPIYCDDTLKDLGLRIQHEEQELLIEVLKGFRSEGINTSLYSRIEEGSRYSAMPQELEADLNCKLVEYRGKRARVSCDS